MAITRRSHLLFVLGTIQVEVVEWCAWDRGCSPVVLKLMHFARAVCTAVGCAALFGCGSWSRVASGKPAPTDWRGVLEGMASSGPTRSAFSIGYYASVDGDRVSIAFRLSSLFGLAMVYR